MAKLVEILARELKEWPEDCEAIEQDRRGSCLYKVNGPAIATYVEAVADDADTAKVTRAQWQAERDRQKGGEWKRHRAGRNQPVNAGVRVEVKFRCGDIQQGNAHEFIWLHSECDVSANIMQCRIISQPQSEEVEVDKFCMGANCNATAESIVHSHECEAEHEASYTGAWDQMETPFKWRDKVNELDAYIEKYTRERDELIERLASEGFALIPPVVSVVSGFSGVDMSDWRNWKAGDIVVCVEDYNKQFTQGKKYVLSGLDKDERYPRVQIKSDDMGEGNGWGAKKFKFHSRP